MGKKLNLIAQANYNVPSYMGEFNYFKSLDAWSKGLDLLNNNDINWTIWTYKVVSEHGNWGLYNQQIPSTNCETDSYEQIYNNWSKVGSSYPNAQLIDTVKWFLNQNNIERNYKKM